MSNKNGILKLWTVISYFILNVHFLSKGLSSDKISPSNVSVTCFSYSCMQFLYTQIFVTSLLSNVFLGILQVPFTKQ